MTARRRRHERHVQRDSVRYSVGPLVLDIAMARALGWSELDLETAARQLTFISRRMTDRAWARHPDRYNATGDVFVGRVAP